MDEAIEKNLSSQRKCELLGASSSTVCTQRKPNAGRRNEKNMLLARKIEEICLKSTFCGSRRFAREISREGRPVNRKRIQGLIRLMDLAGQAPCPMTSKLHPHHTIPLSIPPEERYG
jgi:putative transposase